MSILEGWKILLKPKVKEKEEVNFWDLKSTKIKLGPAPLETEKCSHKFMVMSEDRGEDKLSLLYTCDLCKTDKIIEYGRVK